MRVVVESPYRASTQAEVDANLGYLGQAMKHQLMLGHTPFASHGLYTLPGCLDDLCPHERRLGIEAGLEFALVCEATAVYIDRGISPGMLHGVKAALGVRPVLFISLHGKTVGELNHSVWADLGISDEHLLEMQRGRKWGDSVNPDARWYLLPTSLPIFGTEILKNVV